MRKSDVNEMRKTATSADPDSSRVDIDVDIAGGCCRHDYLRLLVCVDASRLIGCGWDAGPPRRAVTSVRDLPPAEQRGGRMPGGLDKDRGGDEARWQA